MPIIFRLTCLIVLLSTGQVQAQSIQQLFKDYREHLVNEEYLMALDKVEQALRISRKQNGEDNATTLALKLNFAQLYVTQRDLNPDYDAPRAMGLLNEYLDYYTDKDGNNSLTLIDPLMALGTAHLWYESPLRDGQREFRDRTRRFGGDRQTRTEAIRDGRLKAITQFTKAINIAKENSKEYPLLAADLQFEVAKELFARGIEAEQGHELLRQAHNTYATQLDNTDARVILSAFGLARAFAISKKFAESNQYFEKVVAGYQAAGMPGHDKVIEAYRALVENYQIMGSPELATPYIQDLGRVLPWFNVREQVPIYKPEISMKSQEDGQSAEGIFLLTIDTEGKVSEVAVLDYNGDEALRTVMQDALTQRRYAPRYKEGVLVTSQTQATLSIQAQ